MSSLVIVEVVAIVLFSWAFWASRRSGRSLEFLTIVLYGVLLEELDMRIFKSYHYSSEFVLTIAQVPLCIALLWAVILAGSMAISDKLGLPTYVRPLMDGLLAVWLDLSIDAIAIRLDYWSWSIPLTEGWFGVPGANLNAWIWVAFFFSGLARILRCLTAKNKKWQWAYLLLPGAAFVGLYLGIMAVNLAAKASGLTTQDQRLIFVAGHTILFLVVVIFFWKKRVPPTEEMSSVWPISRLTIHLFFIVAGTFSGVFRAEPILAVIAFLVPLAEIMFLYRFCRSVSQKSN